MLRSLLLFPFLLQIYGENALSYQCPYWGLYQVCLERSPQILISGYRINFPLAVKRVRRFDRIEPAHVKYVYHRVTQGVK